ncbi:hypothetical protein HKD37_08G021640 [Glycine soja]
MADTAPSAASLDRLEAAMASLASMDSVLHGTHLRLDAFHASMLFKLDLISQQLDSMIFRQRSPFPSSVPPPQPPLPPPLLFPSSAQPSPPPLPPQPLFHSSAPSPAPPSRPHVPPPQFTPHSDVPPPLPMLPPIPYPAPKPPNPTPKPASLPMAASHGSSFLSLFSLSLLQSFLDSSFSLPFASSPLSLLLCLSPASTPAATPTTMLPTTTKATVNTVLRFTFTASQQPNLLHLHILIAINWSDLPFPMPEHHTRQVTLDKLDDAVQRLSQSQVSLTEGQASLSQSHHSLNSKIDTIHASLTSQIESLFDRLAAVAVPHSSPILATQPPPSPVSRHHHLKLDVPRFDGHDPLGWIFKISQFFDYQGIPEPERLTIASFYMDGPALSWYQWMHRNGYFPSWPAMLQALESRILDE